MAGELSQALQNLLLPEYAGIKHVFGDLLVKRSRQQDSDCFIFRLLSRNQEHELAQLNTDSAVYVRELGLDQAQRKCKHEVMGDVKRPAREFNRRCGAFWSEMAAVRVLAQDGFHSFNSIANRQNEQTSDYRAFYDQIPAYIEVKNVNANDTVFDFFLEQIRDAYVKDPSGYAIHLVLEYAYDDPPTREQERIISAFIRRIRGRQTPFSEVIDLLKAPATVEVIDGEGRVALVRGVGGDSPEAVDYEWLLRKVWDRAVGARSQIPRGDHMKVLVINVDTTNAMLDFDFIEAAKQKIREAFDGDVRPYVLHFRHPTPTLSGAASG